MNKKPWHKKTWKERRKELLVDKCAWCSSTEKLVLHHTKLDHGNFEDYEKLDPSEVITICKRCHWAFHHDMDLCPVCRKFYKQMWYPTCYTCKDLPNNHLQPDRGKSAGQFEPTAPEGYHALGDDSQPTPGG